MKKIPIKLGLTVNLSSYNQSSILFTHKHPPIFDKCKGYFGRNPLMSAWNSSSGAALLFFGGRMISVYG
jgi:hypothetical protein